MLKRRHGAPPPLRDTCRSGFRHASVRRGGFLAALALVVAAPAGADLRFCARTDLRLNTSTPHSVAVADFYAGNGPDLAVTFGAARELVFWRNDGSGNFTEADTIVPPAVPATNSTIVDPAAIISADFNGDGLPDVAGTNKATAHYFAYLNDGAPTPWDVVADDNANRGDGNAIVATNWNGDAAIDLVIAQDAGAVCIALGEAAPGSRWGAVNRFTTTSAGTFADVEADNFVDLTGESGTMDILAADSQFGQLVIWPGDPVRAGQVFSDAASLVLIPVTDAGGARLSPVETVKGNWDGDPWPDVLVGTAQGVVLYFHGNGLPSVFDAPIRFDAVAGLGVAGRMPTEWSSMKYEDVVGADGIRDLVIADAGEPATERGFNWITVIRGTADAPQPPAFDAADQQHFAMGNMSPARPGSVAVADVDQDSDLDIIALHGDSSALTILRSDGGTTFDAPLSFSAGARQPRGAAAGRLDGDSFDDVVTAPASPADPALRGAPFVFAGNGTDELGMPRRGSASGLDTPLLVTVGSVNTAEDAFSDVVVSHLLDQANFEGRGDGTFAAPSPLGISGRIELAQIHGSPDTDIAVVERASGRLRTFEGDGRGGFTLRETFTTPGATDVAVGSFFTSGPDIVVAGTDLAGFNFGLHVLTWNSATSAHDAPVFIDFNAILVPPVEVKFLEAAQVDGGGPPELFVISSGGDAFVLRVSGTSFVGDAGWTFGSSAAGAVVQDLNGDGVLDLAVADASSVRLREGVGGGSFGPLLTLPSNIANDGLAAADLDGDGLPELVAVSRYTSDLTVFCNGSVGALRLRVGHPAPDDTLNWTDLGAGITWQLASGTIAALWANENLSDAVCLASPAGTQYDDVRPLPGPVPPYPSGYWYLLKCSGGACSEPDFGTTSDGTPRFGPGSPGNVPDPCP